MRQEYFVALVDATVESSVRYVREYVHAYLSDTLSEARGHIQEYADSFNHTVQAALITQQHGKQRTLSLVMLASFADDRTCAPCSALGNTFFCIYICMTYITFQS